MSSTISSDPGLEPIPGDAGISLPSDAPSFPVAPGGHRHRELQDLRAFEARFGARKRGAKYVEIDWAAVQRYRRACIGGRLLLDKAQAAPARYKPFALHVPLELRRPAELANSTRPPMRPRHALALGWVITATDVLAGAGLYVSHRDVAALIGVSVRTAGDTMRELAELGLVTRVPLYRARGATEAHPVVAGKSLAKVRQAVAYELTPFARTLFGVRPRPVKRGGWGKRQMARAIVAGVDQSGVENCQGTAQTDFLRKSGSDARAPARAVEEGFAARAGGAGGFAGRSATSPHELELAGEPSAAESTPSSAAAGDVASSSLTPEAPEGAGCAREARLRRETELEARRNALWLQTMSSLQRKLEAVTRERDALRDGARVTSRDVTSPARIVDGDSAEPTSRDVTNGGG